MAKKKNNQVSTVRQAKHGWILALVFTVISILWIAPILVVILNSFKRKAFIFRHPFGHLEQSRYPMAGMHLRMV